MKLKHIFLKIYFFTTIIVIFSPGIFINISIIFLLVQKWKKIINHGATGVWTRDILLYSWKLID